MKKEIRDRWVTALRSGDYPQGTGALNEGGKCCVMGVLCDLAAKDGVVEMHEDGWGQVAYDGHPSTPPKSVVEWSGLDEYYGASGWLIAKNDDGSTFSELADWIEQNL